MNTRLSVQGSSITDSIIPRSVRITATLLGFVACTSIAFAFTVPANDGFVTDTTNTLSETQKQDINARLDAYRKETSNEIAILLVSTLGGEDISEVGVQVGRAWGVGDKEKNNGILLLVALEDREMTIQTGYGLEGAVPDLVAKGIIDTDLAPNFREGNYYEGLLAAIDSLQKHIGGEYTADRYDSSPSGFPQFLIFFAVILFQVGYSVLGRTKSWWLGGVVGAVVGIFLAFLFSWWLSIPILFIIGLIIDFIASKFPPGRGPRGRGGRYFGGGGGFGGGSSGFGGFGGGSFGGGGASGKW